MRMSMKGRRRGITLPPRTMDEVLEAYPAHRQSALGRMDNCSLSMLFDFETPDFTNHPQARGIIGHRAAGEILQTLRRTGEVSMQTSEALEILYEVAAQRNTPDNELVTLPMREQRLLRIAIIRLVSGPDLTMRNLEAVEQRLWSTVEYPEMKECPTCVHYPKRDGRYGQQATGKMPDGAICPDCGNSGDEYSTGSGRVPTGVVIQRAISGRPDALIWDPPDGMIALDWKFSWGVPARGKEDEHVDDADHVSYMGYFQQRAYAYLIMAGHRMGETALAYPAVDRVVLREFYPMTTEARWGTVLRSDLEHIGRELATHTELLDRGLMGGSASKVWQPTPGRHCSYCDAPNRCPLTADVKMLNGGIGTIADAERYAREWIVVKQLDKVLRNATKAWVDTRGPLYGKGDKGRWALRWSGPKGRRKFGFTVPDASDRGSRDKNLEGVFKDVAKRKKEAAHPDD